VDYSADLQRAARWGAYFAETWVNEAPIRIHSSAIGEDGAPRWSPDFERWLTMEEGKKGDRRPEEELRTSRVMRRLRRVAVREFEVLYRVLVMREPVADTTRWLNDRAAANGIPLPEGRSVHYREKDTMALLIAGIAWALHHW
jgi:hypothetical protein